MTSGGVGKLRQVLDYWSCGQCLRHATPDQDYYCAVCRRVQRDVVQRPRLIPVVRVKPTRSDAIRVIPPEEWEAAVQAKARVSEQDLEVARFQQREEELQAQMGRLSEELERLKRQEPLPGGTERPTQFELVGVRKPEPPPEAEVSDEDVEFLEEFEELPEEAAWTPLEPVPGGQPYQHKEYTLYVRDVPTKGRGTRPLYFFSKSPKDDASPTELPAGYAVAENPRTGLPYLKKAGAQRRKK